MNPFLRAKVIIVKTTILATYSVLIWSCKETDKLAPSFISHPNDVSKKVEYYLKRPKINGPLAAIILIHGHQVGSKPGGRDFVDWGVLDRFAKRGFVAVAVSQPGYGGSDGPPDYCGSFTQKAVIAVIDQLVSEDIINPDQIILEGVSRGAVVAGLVAAKDEKIKGLILISGVYDFIDYKEASKTEGHKRSIINSVIEETGNSEDSLRSRSVINFAQTIKARTLILNGANDQRTNPKQARELTDEINRYVGSASFVLFKNTGHQIPVDKRNKIIDTFLFNLITDLKAPTR